MLDYGKRLYRVMAKKSTADEGGTIAAGIGWVMEKNRRFELFVEHDGEGRDEVIKRIRSSLNGMIAGRPEHGFSPIEYLVEEALCDEYAICVLVAAVYQVDDWV